MQTQAGRPPACNPPASQLPADDEITQCLPSLVLPPPQHPPHTSSTAESAVTISSPTASTPLVSPYTAHPDAGPFPHQVAGHDPLLTLAGTSLLAKPCSDTEALFYQCAPLSLRPFMPRLHAVTDSSYLFPKGARYRKAVIIENLLYGLRRPHVMDVKLGRVLTGPDVEADVKKVERLRAVSEGSTASTLGLRITGCKVVRESLLGGDEVADGEYTAGDEFYTFPRPPLKTLQLPLLLEILRRFLQPSPALTIGRYLAAVESLIQSCIDSPIRMFSASLLLAHSTQGESQVRLKLIDFAHAWSGEWFGKQIVGQDENVLEGLRNFRMLLEQEMSLVQGGRP